MSKGHVGLILSHMNAVGTKGPPAPTFFEVATVRFEKPVGPHHITARLSQTKANESSKSSLLAPDSWQA